VPHHGSAWSDPAFLQATRAGLAVISVGVDNDYGHPSPLLLDEMKALGATVLRTDLQGDIAVTESGNSLVPLTRRAEGSALTAIPSEARDTMAVCRPPPTIRRARRVSRR
jgi:competence protein ComEC